MPPGRQPALIAVRSLTFSGLTWRSIAVMSRPSNWKTPNESPFAKRSMTSGSTSYGSYTTGSSSRFGVWPVRAWIRSSAYCCLSRPAIPSTSIFVKPNLSMTLNCVRALHCVTRSPFEPRMSGM